jgi:hypothetical protein
MHFWPLRHAGLHPSKAPIVDCPLAVVRRGMKLVNDLTTQWLNDPVESLASIKTARASTEGSV